MNPRALIGLGSNLGDRRTILDAAVEALGRVHGVNLVAVSPYHETLPVGGPPGQGPFLNGAAVLEPSLDPRALLGVLQQVEVRFGRERTVRWGERTLDLDLLLYGDHVLLTPELVVPHPRFPFRRFALAPAAEVAPSAIDPLTQRTVADLLSNLDRRPSLLCLDHLDRACLLPEPGILPDVHRRVIEGLGAVGIAMESVPAGRCQPSDPWKRHYRRITELGRSLSARRWEVSRLPEQWIVANFSLTQEMLRVAAALGRATGLGRRRPGTPFGLARAQRVAAASVRGALRPTLVTLLRGKERPSADARHYLHPLLIPESSDPSGIVEEILTACAATRD